MDLIKEIKKSKFTEEKTTNKALQFQNLRESYTGKYTFIGKYLHIVYAGLDKETFDAFENELGIKPHNTISSLLKEYNGFNLFSNSFSLYGFGKIKQGNDYLTSRNSSIPLPFGIYEENNGKINPKKIKIGSVCESGLYIDNMSGLITREDRNGNQIESWQNVNDCVEDLFFRLKQHYDEKGICKDSIIINNLFFNKVKEI